MSRQTYIRVCARFTRQGGANMAFGVNSLTTTRILIALLHFLSREALDEAENVCPAVLSISCTGFMKTQTYSSPIIQQYFRIFGFRSKVKAATASPSTQKNCPWSSRLALSRRDNASSQTH